MCTKYSPHRLHLPCRGGGGNGAVVEAADHARPDLEAGSVPNPKAHFHLYEVSSDAITDLWLDIRSRIVCLSVSKSAAAGNRVMREHGSTQPAS